MVVKGCQLEQNFPQGTGAALVLVFGSPGKQIELQHKLVVDGQHQPGLLISEFLGMQKQTLLHNIETGDDLADPRLRLLIRAEEVPVDMAPDHLLVFLESADIENDVVECSRQVIQLFGVGIPPNEIGEAVPLDLQRILYEKLEHAYAAIKIAQLKQELEYIGDPVEYADVAVCGLP